MKDGVIIQVGTAEEIILNPADDHLAEFVAGISRLHLIKAHSVMVPAAAFQAERPGTDVAALQRTSPETDIDQLIDMTLASRGKAIAVAEDGAVIASWRRAASFWASRGRRPPNLCKREGIRRIPPTSPTSSTSTRTLPLLG